MKKRGFVYALALALPALAFAWPSMQDMYDAYMSAARFYADVLGPSTSSADNLIKRYATFRTTMYKDMGEYTDKSLAFAWGEPVFFTLDEFSASGEGDWLADLADYGVPADKSVSTNILWYCMWLYERVNDDCSRQWVIAARDKSADDDMGDDLYEIDVTADYMPYANANALIKAYGLEPTRANDGSIIDANESKLMAWIYNMLDPARFRMAVNVMDYGDFLLLQYLAEKSAEESGSGGDDDDDDDPVTPSHYSTLDVTAIMPYISTNTLYSTGVYTNIFICHNPATAEDLTPEPKETSLVFQNRSPLTLHVYVSTNSVAMMARSVGGNDSWMVDNITFETRAQITVALPKQPASTNAVYFIEWSDVD